MIKQLLLFEEPFQEKYEREFSLMKEKYENLRKSQHSRITMLQKEVTELKKDLEFLKSSICKGNIFI